MLVVSEGWFQFGLIVLMVILLAISLFIVHGLLRKKKRAQSAERTSSFLVFLFVLTLYFAVSISVPSAYYADVIIGKDGDRQVEQDHVRYLSFSQVYKVYAIETVPLVREAQGTEVTIETSSYAPLYSFAENKESIVRNDGSIDMSTYINEAIVPPLEQLDSEEITLTQLREMFTHHDFYFE